MTANQAVEMMASARLDPEEADRADIRWAIGMEVQAALAGAKDNYPSRYWLSLLPWRPEHLTPAQRADIQARRDQTMAEFAQAHRERKLTRG